MGNQKHLDILMQGVGEWNTWRDEYPGIEPDLKAENLRGLNLNYAYFFNSDLRSTLFRGTSLNGASLRASNLTGADFTAADLTNALLHDANLTRANFAHANLGNAHLAYTVLASVDLSTAKGLETVLHGAPSSIGIDTIYLSQADIPETFLRGAGVDDTLITYVRSLVGKAIEYYTCFISYSSKDQDFAERLYADLQSKGVRCWYAPYDLKIGDKWRDRIEESIRLHEKLLLVISHHSIESPRVEEEVVGAQEKEERYFRETGVEQLVLFPIRLDESVRETSKAWAASLRRLRHIGDFRNWKDHDAYQKAFNRLLRDLKAEAQKTEAREGTVR